MKRNDLLAKSLTLGLAVATAAASMSMPVAANEVETYAEAGQEANENTESTPETAGNPFSKMDASIYSKTNYVGQPQNIDDLGDFTFNFESAISEDDVKKGTLTVTGNAKFVKGYTGFSGGRAPNGYYVAWQMKLPETTQTQDEGNTPITTCYLQTALGYDGATLTDYPNLKFEEITYEELDKVTSDSTETRVLAGIEKISPDMGEIKVVVYDKPAATSYDKNGTTTGAQANTDAKKLAEYTLDFSKITSDSLTFTQMSDDDYKETCTALGWTAGTDAPAAVASMGAVELKAENGISGTVSVSGQAAYVEGFTGFSTDKSEGNYVAWKLALPAEKTAEAVYIESTDGTKTIGDKTYKKLVETGNSKIDHICEVRYVDSSKKSVNVIIDWDGKGVTDNSADKNKVSTFTLDFSNVKLKSKNDGTTGEEKPATPPETKPEKPSTPSTGDYTGGGGSGSSSSGSTTTDTSKKDETSKTETKPDGSTVTTTETKNNDGSTTTKTETTKKDGSTETKTETKKNDGSTETKTETKKTDGSTETKTEVKKTDGSTESKTEVKKTDGSTEKKTEVKKTDGSSKTTTEIKNADGSSEKTTETVKADGSSTSKKVIKEEGTKVVVNTEKDADGDMISVKANVQTVSEDDSASILAEMVEKLVEEAGTTDLNISQRIYDSKGKTICKVNVNASDLKAGKKLKVFKIDSETGELTVVNNETYKVDKDGNVSFDGLQKANYQVMTASEASKYVKEVLSTVKPENSKKTVTEGKKTKFKLDDGLNMGNVKGITYKTSKKSVATVDKNGNITTKKSGKVVVKATVTLKNGKKKTVKMTITVKA